MRQDLPLEFLYAALQSPFGVAITVSDLDRTRQALYRAKATDPDLDLLSICVSPVNPTSELWIIRKAPPDASP